MLRQLYVEPQKPDFTQNSSVVSMLANIPTSARCFRSGRSWRARQASVTAADLWQFPKPNARNTGIKKLDNIGIGVGQSGMALLSQTKEKGPLSPFPSIRFGMCGYRDCRCAPKEPVIPSARKSPKASSWPEPAKPPRMYFGSPFSPNIHVPSSDTSMSGNVTLRVE